MTEHVYLVQMVDEDKFYVFTDNQHANEFAQSNEGHIRTFVAKLNPPVNRIHGVVFVPGECGFRSVRVWTDIFHGSKLETTITNPGDGTLVVYVTETSVENAISKAKTVLIEMIASLVEGKEEEDELDA